MGEYTGLAMFLWIVGAPTIGLLILSIPRDRHRGLYPRRADAPREQRRPY